jgi:hypothetical protein
MVGPVRDFLYEWATVSAVTGESEELRRTAKNDLKFEGSFIA